MLKSFFRNIRLEHEIKRELLNDYLKQTWRLDVRRKIAYLKAAGHME